MLHKPALGISLGAALLITAAEGLIIVPQHSPGHAGCAATGGFGLCTPDTSPATGLPRSVYDSLLIGTWALLIIGTLLATIGLINHARR